MRRSAGSHRAFTSTFSWLRALVSFRHRSRGARTLSVGLAMAVSLLLVGSAGPVYADTTAAPTDPTKAATTTADASPSVAAATPSSTPSPTSAPTSTAIHQGVTPTPAAPATTGATKTLTTTSSSAGNHASTSTRKTVTRAPSVIVNVAPTSPDWIYRGSAAILHDGVADAGGYSNGSSEGQNPADWQGFQKATNKYDIVDYYLNTDTSGGDVIANFGFTRDATNGDTGFSVELNQQADSSDSPPKPDRLVGDLLMKFDQPSGSSTLIFAHAYLWTAKANYGSYPMGCQAVTTTNGWCEIPRSGFTGRTADAGSTAEGKVDLTSLFGNQGCSAVFHAINMRSESSSENWNNSLQDYISPIAQTIPSTCATLVIKKLRSGTGTLLTGAHFAVYKGSTATGTPLYADVTDGSAPDTDNVAGQITIAGLEPGTYTVKETQAPPGYFLPTGADAVVTHDLAKSATVEFSFSDVKQWQALTVSKDAAGSYDATYHWSITKGVGSTEQGPFADHLTKKVPDDLVGPSSATFGYQVTVTEGARTTSNIAVTGNLYVANPNNEPVDVTLSDTLAGASCSFADDTVTVPANATHQAYAYSCTYPANTDPASLGTTNHAGIAWVKATYPQTLADSSASGSYTAAGSSAVTWTAHEHDKTVTVTDSLNPFVPAWTITWSAQGTQHTKTYTGTVSADPGQCHTAPNTASVIGDNSATLASASASATVCVGTDLTVTKLADPSLTRTYLWSIHKSADQTSLTTDASGHATAHYTVNVAANGSQDSAWMMTGSITVANPNAWEDVTLTSLSDVFDGSALNDQLCQITDWNSVSHVVPQGGSRTYHYSCTFSKKPTYDGTNHATAQWDAVAASTTSGSATGSVGVTAADWEPPTAEVNKTVSVYDDNAGQGSPTLLGTATWSSTYSHDFHYTTDLTAALGQCRTWHNTATIVGDSEAILGSSSADVDVCHPTGLTATKSVDAGFTRTYDWSITKGVTDPATVHVDSYHHTFDYTVTVSPDGSTDGAWTMTGSIHVTNPNADTGIAPITATVTDVPVGVGGGVSCVVNGGDNQVTLASGDSADVPYSCSFTGDPNATGGSNVAHITWNDGASSTTASSPVTFAMTHEVNKTVSVYDDKVTTPGGILLGTATWDQPETFHYSLPLTAPSTECAAFVNHAWVTGDDQSKLDQAMATATICPNPGTWTVDKSSTPGDGASVPTGSDVVYHVHATKTGGVDPTDVVVVDDMSDVAPYITGAPTFTAPAGTTASYDSSTHLLTWTIDTLSGTDTLDVTVHIAPDAYDVDLHNVVTSRGSSNCPDEETAADVPACSTDHLTPAYTLEKSSSVLEGGTVMPPYRGADGDTITYTLTVRNTSDAVINETTLPGAAVTDDLSDVLDNATFNSGSITPSGGTADLAGTTLTWHLPTIQPGGTATLTYTVTVKTGSSAATTWDQVLHNQAAPGDGGTCVVSEFSQDELCDTTAVTPPVTTLQVEKVDAETGAPLDGATFALYLDNAPTDAAQVGPEDTALGTASTGPDGIAQFPELLPGSYLVKETTAPTGYDLPANDTMQVVIGENNFVAGGLMTPIEFRDPAQGQIGITKAQYELDTSGNWVPSDGVVDYGDTVKYVLQVDSTGPKLFHDVTLTDYVPGYNPADVTSTAKATLVPGSAVCTGSLTCTVTTDATTGLVTWSAGTLSTDSGTAEMVVTFPQLPSPVPFDATGTYTTTIWNVGYLDWNEVTGPESAPVGHHLTSNEVTEQATTTQVVTPPVVTPPVVTPPVVSPPHAAPPPPATTLPNTGGPQGWYLPVGLGLVLMGTGLVLGERRRRRV